MHRQITLALLVWVTLVGIALPFLPYPTVANAQSIPSTLGWYQIPNTKIETVCAATHGFPEVRGNTGCAGIFAWSGGVFDTARNRLIVWGGGHSDYYGNELYALDLNDLTMRRITDPGLPLPDLNLCLVTTANGTQPGSRHTFDGFEYIPGRDVLFAHGGVPSFTNSEACWANPEGGRDTWLFDFNTQKWQRLTPTGDIPNAPTGLVMAHDPNTGKVFLDDKNGLYTYDFATNYFQRLSKSPWPPLEGYSTSVIDPKRKQFVIIGGGSVYGGHVYVYDIGPGSTYARQELITTGGSAIVNSTFPGLAYDPVTDRIVAWNGGDTVYSLNLDTRVWTATTYPNGPGAPNGSGTYERWSYAPALNAFVLVNAYNQNAYIFRLTSAAPDTTPPTVSITTPTNGSTILGTIAVSANAADNVGVSGVQFKLDGANLQTEDTTAPYSLNWDTTSTPNGSHTITATARDGAGNQTTSSAVSVTVNNPVDTTPPSTPTNLTATAISSSQITLSWTASTDNVGVTGYRVERCQGAGCATFSQIATPASNSYADTGLSANTTYQYRLRAADAAGNLSGYSSTVSATTHASAAFDFSLTNGGNISVIQGSTMTNVITATLLSGTSQSVSFSTSGLPTGAAASNTPTSCSPACTATLTITAQATTPTGSYPITVTGTAGSLTRTTSFTLTVSALGNVGADFQARCSAPGVIKCVGMDSASDVSAGIQAAWDGVLRGTLDTSIKASGAGSLRFEIPPFSAANTSGAWSSSLGANFGPGSTFYVQFRERFSPEMLTIRFPGGGGWKQAIFHMQGKTCASIELTTQNSFYIGFPQMYTDCGARPFAIDIGNGDLLLQQGDYNCHYQNQNPTDCAYYQANQWMTFSYEVKLGNWGEPTSSIKAWVGYEGGPLKQFVNMVNYPLYENSSLSDVYNYITLLPYNTGKDSTASHPTAYVWYDELIVSTQPIAAPGASSPPAVSLAPPTNLRILQ